MTDDEFLKSKGLVRVDVGDLLVRRRRRGRQFVYFDERGERIDDPAVLQRVRSLAIPPNYVDVRIAADPNAHLQAVGHDAAGRLQYRYHPTWEEVREHRKIDRLASIARCISGIRNRVQRDLRTSGFSQRRACAAVVDLIDRTHVRIGCADYVHTGRSRGGATLDKRNVKLSGDTAVLSFRGKGGRRVETAISSPHLARAIRALRRLPGRRLFQFLGDDGRVYAVSERGVNAYLRDIVDADVTAKDFRTLAASAMAAERLCSAMPAESVADARRKVRAAIVEIAEELANTPAVTRKSYVHSRVVQAFASGELAELGRRARGRRRQSKGEAMIAILFADADAE